MATDCTTFI